MSGEDVRTLVLQIISENYLGPKFWSTTVKLIHDGGGGGGQYAHIKLYCIALYGITLIPPLISSTRFTPHHCTPIQRD